jgi:hypothetical protein
MTLTRRSSFALTLVACVGATQTRVVDPPVTVTAGATAA